MRKAYPRGLKPVGRNAVGASTVFGWERLDEALGFEAADAAVEGAGAEARAAETGDVEPDPLPTGGNVINRWGTHPAASVCPEENRRDEV